MRIVSLATNDLRGGAARSAYRLHRGLRLLGMDARMVVRWKQSNDPSVTPVDDSWTSGDYTDRERSLRQRWVRDNRTPLSDTLFSLGHPSLPIADHPLVRSADVVHLHWVANFLGPVSFDGLARLGCPVVWTLHDEWGYTGGCHYAAGCGRFKQGCDACPQLQEDPLRLVHDLFRARRQAWEGADLTIVAPSRWIGRQSAASAILGRKSVRHIPYGLDVGVFRPLGDAARRQVRAALGVRDEEHLLAFGVDRVAERRKGYRDLVDALTLCDPRLVLLRFGDARDAAAPRQRTIDLGSIDDDARLAEAYAAADCFVLPTLEDNSPNGVLESMACGTPVVAYATGGVPDVVEEGVTGFLARTGDVADLAMAIGRSVASRAARTTIARHCVERIAREHTLERQADRCIALYEELLAPSRRAVAPEMLEASA